MDTKSSRILHRLALGWLMLLLSVTGSAQVQFVLEPTRDNSLFEGTATENSNGSGNSLFAGRINQGPLRRALLAFDDLPEIPPGARIVSVELALHVSRSRSPESQFQLHRVTADWGEGASAAAEPGGQGTTAQNGDATWNYRFFQSEPWQNPGGDFDPAISSSTAVSGVFTYTFPSTPTMIADVESWIASPATNFGWLLRGDEAESVTTARRFESRENSNAEFRPELRITVELTQASLSGLYFNTQTPGEGYLMFITPSGNVVFYFGYNDDGSQLWLISDTFTSPIEIGVVTSVPMKRGIGGTFASPVPPESLSDYGNLDMLFSDGCLGGEFILTGPEGTKSQAVVKLANVAGTGCS